MNRKYPKVKGHWNYCFIFPDGMFYIGKSGGKKGNKQCCNRWIPLFYKNTVVEPYIEKYGWDNIRKVVLKDGLTEEQSIQLEDLLIQEARKGGWCINAYRSGGNRKNEYYEEYHKEIREQQKEYYQLNKKEIRILQKTKYQNNKEERIEKQKKYYYDNKEERKEYNKKWYSKIENKIYARVATKKNKIITPDEAKEMYLLTGYIPDFIKNDDLQ